MNTAVLERVLAFTFGLMLLSSTAVARTEMVIPPGREDAVFDLVRAAVAEDPPAVLLGVSIEGGTIIVRVGQDGQPAAEIAVGPPGQPTSSDAGNVGLRCPGSCDPQDMMARAALVEALARQRDRVAERIWVTPASPPAPEIDAALDAPLPTNGRRRVTVAVLAFAVFWLLTVAMGGLRRFARRPREWLPLAAVLALFVTVALVVPERLPVHEHNSFVSRSDCAWDAGCDEASPVGWSPPVFHVYHLLLGLLPNRLEYRGLVSLGLVTLAAALSYVFLRLLFVQFERPQAGRVAALWATVLFLVQPSVLRIAVSDTFWPFVLVALWASGIALLVALRTGSFAAMIAGVGWFSLALLGNLLYLALLPIALVAPLAWRRGVSMAPRWAAPVAAALGLALVAPWYLATFTKVFLGPRQGPGLVEILLAPLDLLSGFVRANLWLHPTLTPAVMAGLLFPATLAALTSYRRLILPIAGVYLLTEPVMSAFGSTDPLEYYPSRLLNAFPGLHILAVLAGCGIAWLHERAKGGAWRLHGALAGLLLVTLPFSAEGWRFVTGSTVLGRELVELGQAFEKLPQHDLLIIPPLIHPTIPGSRGGSDPLEARFPQGEYRWVLAHRGLEPARIQPLDHFLETGADEPADGRILFYLGSTLRTFLQMEVAGEVVPDGLERSSLVALRQRYLLEPVHVFQLETQQHPGFAGRLAADRVPEVELGFYWLKRRPSASAFDAEATAQ